MMSRSGDPPLPCTTGLASVVVYDSMIDVVILAWNDGELLDQAVESALASVGSELRVWIVDNGSDPPVPAPTDPRVRLLRNDHNAGVSGGRNQGVHAGTAGLVCLLDSDARLEPECLSALTSVLERRPDVALTAPVFNDQAPEASAGRAPTVWMKVSRALNLRAKYDPVTEVDGTWDVDFAIGAPVVPPIGLDAVGGLDERYFYGPEDVDFCLRLREAGFGIVQVGAGRCEHPPRRRNKKLLTRRGLQHGVAVTRHLWRHRSFRRRVPASV